MGTPAFAVRSLEACLTLGEVVAVVTQPDKPRGRGHEVSFSPVKQLALERGLPVLQPLKLRGADFAAQLAALRPDVAVVTAYGKLLPKDVLEAPAHGCVNVHASLLPRFRGAAPIQWAIASGDETTGVCLMKMDEGMDTGGVIDRAERRIGPTDTSATLHEALAALGGEVLRRALPRYLAGELTPVPQPTEGVVLAPMIRKEDGALDFSRPAVVLERRLRAFTPWPGAFTTLDGALFKVHAASVGGGTGAPGTLLSV
ncbi:MAG: methionyl-tRNA formyltransferase, partial [Myxococcaceae bacterium]|nr:methionyl-tRNA formyltransferase [Myxococcaceae bacterium]